MLISRPERIAVAALLLAVSGVARSGDLAPSRVATAADAPVLDLVGQTGGVVGALAVQGDRVYAVLGTSLAVIDVANAAAPRLVARSRPLDALITDLAVAGDRAYMTAGEEIAVMDLAAPDGPAVAGAYRADGELRILAADERHVYTVASTSSKAGRFQVLAPGPDGQLALVGEIPLSAGIATDDAQMAASGGTVYIASSNLGVVAIDVSAPDAPAIRGAYEDVAASGIAVGRDRVFVIGSRRRQAGMGQPATTAYLLALSTRPGTYLSPDVTLVLGKPDEPEMPSFVAAWDRFVYLGPAAGGDLRVLDGQQPGALPDVGVVALPPGYGPEYQGPKSIAVDRGRVFVAVNGICGLDCQRLGSLNGLLTVTGPPPGTVTGAWLLDQPADPTVLAAGEGAVAVGAGTQVIHFVETRSPTMPRFQGVMALGDGLTDLAAYGHRLLSSTNVQAKLIDFADPAAPRLIQDMDLGGLRDLRSVAMDADIACAVGRDREADTEARFVVWDLGTDGHLRRQGELVLGPWPDYTYHMTLHDHHAYLASLTTGLTVVDLRDPNRPTIAGRVAIPVSAHAVAVSGGHAYVTTRFATPVEEKAKPNPRPYAGLSVVDVTDPTRPRVVGTYADYLDGQNQRGQRWGVAVVGQHAIVTLHDQWLRVLDLSDPAAPHLAETVRVPSGAYDVAVAGDLAYVAAGEGGLLVYRRHAADAGDGHAGHLFLPFSFKPRAGRVTVGTTTRF